MGNTVGQTPEFPGCVGLPQVVSSAMKLFNVLPLWASALALGIWGSAEAQFNNPEGVDIWCGKAYRAS